MLCLCCADGGGVCWVHRWSGNSRWDYPYIVCHVTPPLVGYPLHCLSCDHPPIVGRLCELVETPSALASRTSCQDLDDYLSKLEEGSGCSQGQAGTLSWTPDENTPDPVYYQVSRLNLKFCRDCMYYSVTFTISFDSFCFVCVLHVGWKIIPWNTVVIHPLW